jgi:hypothetical protein
MNIILKYILILLIACIIYNIVHKKYEKFEKSKTPSGKTIWILWLQGWDKAPWYIHEIKESWKKYNPEWNVELVSEANLSNYIDITLPPNASPAAKSDIIRLNLLCEHGGVWADSTMLCMMPLDLWLYDALQPAGFWMYHGEPIGSDAPASWFIISMKKNYLIQKWKEACETYWSDKSEAHYYFWMDELFMNLIANDPKFKEIWQTVPVLNCEQYGQSHMLAGKCLTNNPELKELIQSTPPYAIKLSRGGPQGPVPDEVTEDLKKTNMYFAITTALNRTDMIFTLPEQSYLPTINIITKDKVFLIADCNNASEIVELQKICQEKDIQMIVYDKCNFGKNVPPEIYCRPLKNVGREQGTYTYFMMQYYNYLPNDIYLIPGNIHKHHRIDRINDMLKDDNYLGPCNTLSGDLTKPDFILDNYDGVRLEPASVRPFKAWYEKFVGIWDENKMSPCWTGIMHTKRDRIKKHTQNYYEILYNEISKHNNGEAGHYGERSMAVMF